jgi:hypothetical protein
MGEQLVGNLCARDHPYQLCKTVIGRHLFAQTERKS